MRAGGSRLLVWVWDNLCIREWRKVGFAGLMRMNLQRDAKKTIRGNL